MIAKMAKRSKFSIFGRFSSLISRFFNFAFCDKMVDRKGYIKVGD